VVSSRGEVMGFSQICDARHGWFVLNRAYLLPNRYALFKTKQPYTNNNAYFK